MVLDWVGELCVEMVGDRVVHLVRLREVLSGGGGGCSSCAEVGRWAGAEDALIDGDASSKCK